MRDLSQAFVLRSALPAIRPHDAAQAPLKQLHALVPSDVFGRIWEEAGVAVRRGHTSDERDEEGNEETQVHTFRK